MPGAVLEEEPIEGTPPATPEPAMCLQPHLQATERWQAPTARPIRRNEQRCQTRGVPRACPDTLSLKRSENNAPLTKARPVTPYGADLVQKAIILID